MGTDERTATGNRKYTAYRFLLKCFVGDFYVVMRMTENEEREREKERKR